MSQYYLSSVNDLQSMEAINRLVQRGICSIGNICTCLSNAHVDSVTDMCFDFQQIRGHIEVADQSLKESERIVKDKLTCLDKCMVRLVKEQQHVQQKKQEKSLTIETLRIRKTSAKESLNASKAAVNQAERNHKTAERELEKMKDLRTTGTCVAVTGAAVTVVPVFGWIAGPLIMWNGLTTVADALDAIKRAENNLGECRSQVRKHKRNVLDCRSRISKTQEEIEQTNQSLSNVQSSIKWLQQRLVAVAEIQHSFRTVVTHMSVLSGRVNVLESHTRSCIYWEPVIKMIQDVGNAIITIANNQILFSQNVPALINTLSEKIKGLKALCTAPENSEYVCYY